MALNLLTLVLQESEFRLDMKNTDSHDGRAIEPGKYRYKVLIVDDDPFIRRLTTRIFKNTIYEPVVSASAEEAAQALKDTAPDLIILDLRLPGIDGGTFLELLRRKSIDLPVLIITGQGDYNTVRKLIPMGIMGYLRKPFTVNELKCRTGSAIMSWRHKRGLPIELDR